MVYVINQQSNPLMPTTRYGKVRRMLSDGRARVVKRTPFTIQLLYESELYKQAVTLGVDAGSKHIGLSAVTDKKELYSGEVALRSDIVKLIASRSEARRTRRNRLRYRAPRFDNRISSKKDGWLAPSIRQRVDSHLRVIENICWIVPVSNIVIETASFDMQKIKNPEISGTDYQQGTQLNFWNTREYVLFRDNHTCQCCHGKSKDDILNVHHIESRQTGGDAPDNLITLCESCHKGYHSGKIEFKAYRRSKSLRDAAFMGIMRWEVYNELKRLYSDRAEVKFTYGYLTKNARIEHNLYKAHHIDARCIAGGAALSGTDVWFDMRQVRRHNRQIHKRNIIKGGRLKLNQAPYMVKGFRLFDKVKYESNECFIFGRRSSGSFDIRLLDGTKVHAGISYKKLQLLEKRTSLLIQKRECGNSSHASIHGFPCQIRA
jgi:hypothetical protein